MTALLEELAREENARLNAVDETAVRREPKLFHGWAPRGELLAVESDGSYKGAEHNRHG